MLKPQDESGGRNSVGQWFDPDDPDSVSLLGNVRLNEILDTLMAPTLD